MLSCWIGDNVEILFDFFNNLWRLSLGNSDKGSIVRTCKVLSYRVVSAWSCVDTKDEELKLICAFFIFDSISDISFRFWTLWRSIYNQHKKTDSVSGAGHWISWSLNKIERFFKRSDIAWSSRALCYFLDKGCVFSRSCFISSGQIICSGQNWRWVTVKNHVEVVVIC